MNDKQNLFVRKFVASLLVVGAIFLLARRSERAAIALESIAGRFHLKIIAFAHQQQASILLGRLVREAARMRAAASDADALHIAPSNILTALCECFGVVE